MTLTAILPSLRRSIPDPLAPARWPAGTAATTTDLRVGAVSMLAVAAERGTPCAVTAPAVDPGSCGRASRTASASVVVLRIRAVTGAPRAILLDADLAGLPAVWEEARLVGRASTAPVRDALLGSAAVRLPADLAVGDLVAVPVACAVDVRTVAVAVAPPAVAPPAASAPLLAAAR